jgi:hypothetical protein
MINKIITIFALYYPNYTLKVTKKKEYSPKPIVLTKDVTRLKKGLGANLLCNLKTRI